MQPFTTPMTAEQVKEANNLLHEHAAAVRDVAAWQRVVAAQQATFDALISTGQQHLRHTIALTVDEQRYIISRRLLAVEQKLAAIKRRCAQINLILE